MPLLNLSFISAVNPWLLLGAAAIAAPIIIHLLSRRKFEVVQWAAMAFLLNAEKRNRRRIRLEHLLLLLLRCLAIILIALLVSRLFFTQSGLAALLGQTARTERIVLLDDSPSTTLRVEARDLLEASKTALVNFVRQTAAERPGDELTLYLTSNPSQPLINGQLFREQETLVRIVENIEPSDAAAQLDQSLLALEEHIAEAEEEGGGAINRLVYVVSDLRQRDWSPAEGGEDDRSTANLLHRLGESSGGVLVVDMGGEMAENLTISAIEPKEKTLVAGIPLTFNVKVRNHGINDARDVEITFVANSGLPQVGYIDEIQAGQEGSAPFTVTFAAPGSVELSASIEADPLPADNTRPYVARLQEGVKVLLVDGDPSTESYRSETHTLAKAISPDDGATSGNDVTIVTESQFAAQRLDDYEVIMLANLYQLSDEQIADLTRWVRAGGGLVFFLGDQVDDQIYNEQLHRGGAGLMPVQLLEVAGDETERTFANIGRVVGNHPMTADMSSPNDPVLKFSKFYRWWRAELPEALAGEELPFATPRVLMALNDEQNSPLIVERPEGDGRVMAIMTTADGDWTNWPAKEGYVITMLELVKYMAPVAPDTANVPVGMPLVHDLPVDTYRREARIWPPDSDEPVTIQAATRVRDEPSAEQADAADESGPDAEAGTDEAPELGGMPMLELRYDRTGKAGIYRVELARHDGSVQELLFAVGVDPTEGDLSPANRSTLREQFGESKVELVTMEQALSAGGAGGRREIWRTIAFVLIGVLCLEQFLAWSFGRRR